MAQFKLVVVQTPKDAKDFIYVNVKINKHNPNYIRPLNKDIRDIFDPLRNKTFQYGRVRRWILRDAQGELIGRIAAFINQRYKNIEDGFLAGGIGFFDCIYDHQAAKILFDAAKDWLQMQGIEAMDGPINFGENDRWWGLLVEGFHSPPYLMNYNLPYYQELFEAYGFQEFYQQLYYSIPLDVSLNPIWYKIHSKYDNDPDFSIKHIDTNNFEDSLYDFTEIVHAGQLNIPFNKQAESEEAFTVLKKLFLFWGHQLILLAYHRERPIAVLFSTPDLNQLLKYLDGKFNFFQIAKLLCLKFFKPYNKVMSSIYAITPEFQKAGIIVYLSVALLEKILKTPNSRYTEYEMKWIGDPNPKMHRQMEEISLMNKNRVLITYRYLFDNNKKIKPA